MNTFALITSLAVVSLNYWAEIIKVHRSSVFMLSAVVAALFSFLMWVAYRRIKTEKWMKFFSWSFGLLSLQYLLFLVDWFRTQHPTPPPAGQFNAADSAVFILFVQLVSMVNNMCAVSAAQNIEYKSPLVPRTAWMLAVATVVTTLFIFFVPLGNPFANILLSRGIASVFSAYCLFKVGFAIFANISPRRHRWMALGAVLVAGVYALLQLAYGASPLLAATSLAELPFEEGLDRIDMLLLGLALPLKFFLCGFAYLLVMRFFETLNEVRNLPKGDEELRQDYLSTNGAARLIASKLGDDPHAAQSNAAGGGARREQGFVNIIVKLPGEVNKRVACIPWPNAEPEQRTITFDWPDPKSFSRRIVKESADTQKAGPEKSDRYEWEDLLPFAGKVMTESTRREFIWRRDDPETYDSDIKYNGDLKSIAHVAIISHGAVVGCLQVARAKYRFSPMAVRQIREIANLLAPAVQAYRELASLDQMSIRFAWKQAEEMTYSPAEASRVIAETLHDVFAPHITRLHMDFGFYGEEPQYVSEPYASVLLKRMMHECDGKEWEKIGTHVFADASEYRLLKKQLTARVTETLSTNAAHHGVKDRFITGNMILAINDRDDEYRRAALGVTYLQRKTASTIAADAYLDFARDYYNGLLKQLSKELSQRRRNAAEWFKPIDLMLKSAGLLWVVVSQKKKNGKLGDDEGHYILRHFNQLAGKENPVPWVGEVKITHHPLKAEYNKTSHVLRLDLPESDCYMWLGVQRPGFGPELDFSSPWRTFLVNFAQIADAALSRIILPEKFQLQLETAQLQGIMASYVTTGTVIHQLSNMIQGQDVSISYLLDAAGMNKLVADEKLIRKIENMKEAIGDMQELFKSLDRITKVDKHRPCQLKDAALHAFKLFRLSIDHRGITPRMQVADGINIDVPFNVAALALANLVGNAKDAVESEGEIKIDAEVNGDFALCRVSDNGGGMPSEVAGVVFDPKDTQKETGSGLGLYLTYHSLIENGSSIELTSTGPSGTVFTVKFPLAKEEGRA